jgi:hypothetical protein
MGENNNRMDPGKLGSIYLAQGKDQWRAVGNMVIKPWVP